MALADSVLMGLSAALFPLPFATQPPTPYRRTIVGAPRSLAAALQPVSLEWRNKKRTGDENGRSPRGGGGGGVCAAAAFAVVGGFFERSRPESHGTFVCARQ